MHLCVCVNRCIKVLRPDSYRKKWFFFLFFFYEVDKHVALAELPPHRVNVAIINFVDLVACVVFIMCVRVVFIHMYREIVYDLHGFTVNVQCIQLIAFFSLSFTLNWTAVFNDRRCVRVCVCVCVQQSELFIQFFPCAYMCVCRFSFDSSVLNRYADRTLNF